MICNHCKSEVDDNNKYCPNCGSNIKIFEKESVNLSLNPIDNLENKTIEKEVIPYRSSEGNVYGGSNNELSVGTAIRNYLIIIILAAMLLFVYFNYVKPNNKSDKVKHETTEETKKEETKKEETTPVKDELKYGTLTLYVYDEDDYSEINGVGVKVNNVSNKACLNANPCSGVVSADVTFKVDGKEITSKLATNKGYVKLSGTNYKVKLAIDENKLAVVFEG